MTQSVLLGDIIKNGEIEMYNNLRAPLNSRQREESRGQYPYYGATGQMDTIDKYKFDGFYILVAEDGTVYGSNGICPMIQRVRGKFWVSNHAHVLKCRDDTDTQYLALALEAADVRPNITGAVQLKLSKDNLSKIKIFWPEREERERILNAINPLDEKIELNRKMNETLEQMGQALFRHYFIDNPEAEKWKIGKLEDIADVSTGRGSVKSQLSETGVVPLYGANGVMGTSEKYLYDDDLIVTGRVGTLGAVRAVTGKAWFSDNVLIMKPKYGCFGFIYHIAKSFDYIAMNRGSSQPLITQTDLKNLTVTIPEEAVLSKFEDEYASIFKYIQMNITEILTLANLRDALLPRLISGKLKL